jgi:NAD+ kinase
MNKSIKTVGILSKPHREKIRVVVPELRAWLEARGIRVMIERETAMGLMSSSTSAMAGAEASSHADLPKNGALAEWAGDLDLAIVLGGDGALLGAARVLGAKQVPILGVNLGSLGFLTSVTLDELYPQLELILAGRHQTNTRMMLEASIIRATGRSGGSRDRHPDSADDSPDGRTIESGFEPDIDSHIAMNDAVVNQAALARLVDFDVHVDSSHIGRYRADGLIVSTPTGSTAYSLAAGGPIVHPALDAFVITPICPHMLTNRPIVIPDTAKVEIEFPQEADAAELALQLTLDGQLGFRLHRGDRVIIRKSANRVILVSPRERTYYEMLRDKLRWGER